MTTSVNPSAPTSSGRIDSHDHGPAVIIAAGIALGTTFMSLVLRMSQRWPWTKLFKVEDALLIAAMFGEVANVASLALAVRYGLGQHTGSLMPFQVDRTKRALIASFAFTFVTECLSSISFIALLRSINPHANYRRVMAGFMAVIIAWAVAGIARVAAASNSAVASLSRVTWIGFAAVWVLIQITLFASSMWTIWILQMDVAKKIGLSLWFSLGLPVVAVTIIRLVYTPAETFSTDFTWTDINMIIISVIESNLSIINAAYPSVRTFLNKVSTGFLVAETATESKSASKGNSYALHSIRGGLRNGAVRARDNMLGASVGEYHGHITAVKGDGKSDRSFGSEVIMVRRSLEIEDRSLADA